MGPQPILSVVFDGVADTVDYQLRELLSAEEGEARRYYRFQTVLDIGKDDMDDACATNIAALKTKARETISKHEAALEAVMRPTGRITAKAGLRSAEKGAALSSSKRGQGEEIITLSVNRVSRSRGVVKPMN